MGNLDFPKKSNMMNKSLKWFDPDICSLRWWLYSNLKSHFFTWITSGKYVSPNPHFWNFTTPNKKLKTLTTDQQRKTHQWATTGPPHGVSKGSFKLFLMSEKSIALISRYSKPLLFSTNLNELNRMSSQPCGHYLIGLLTACRWQTCWILSLKKNKWLTNTGPRSAAWFLK